MPHFCALRLQNTALHQGCHSRMPPGLALTTRPGWLQDNHSRFQSLPLTDWGIDLFLCIEPQGRCADQQPLTAGSGGATARSPRGLWHPEWTCQGSRLLCSASFQKKLEIWVFTFQKYKIALFKNNCLKFHYNPVLVKATGHLLSSAGQPPPGDLQHPHCILRRRTFPMNSLTVETLGFAPHMVSERPLKIGR